VCLVCAQFNVTHQNFVNILVELFLAYKLTTVGRGGHKKPSTEHRTELTGTETEYTETEMTENNFGA
jgi:hypothetical protein